MHHTAMMNCKHFFDCYGTSMRVENRNVVIDIGAQDVNGSLREVTPKRLKYVGVDMVPGRGVDIVLDDPYILPFETDSVDVVLSSSCFEHSEMFWVIFLEIMRVLKPTGLFYLNVPSGGNFHRYPVDCWRFYPDSGNALVAWARRNGINACLLESYTSRQDKDIWNDFVGIILKDEEYAELYPDRVTSTISEFDNAISRGNPNIIKYSELPGDRRAIGRLLKSAAAELIRRRLKLGNTAVDGQIPV